MEEEHSSEPTPQRPWYTRRAAVISLASIAAVAIASAIIVPTLLDRSPAEGDADAALVADEYLAAADAFEGMWTEDAITAASSTVLSDLIDTNADSDDQESARAGELAPRCEALVEDLDRVEVLALAIPRAPDQRTIDASSEVAERSSLLSPAVEAASEFVEVSRESLGEMVRLCRSVEKLNELRAAFDADSAARLAPLRTVAEGQGQTVGQFVYTCEESSGCVPIQDSAARIAYGDAYEEVYGTWIQALLTEVETNCQFPDLPGYCEADRMLLERLLDIDSRLAEAWRSDAAASDGSSAVPGVDAASRERTALFDEPQDPEVVAAIREVDPEYSANIEDEPAGYLGRVISDFEADIAAARDAVVAASA